MSTTVPRAVSGHSEPEKELQAELGHIRDLVFVRDLLTERGATAAERRKYDAVIDQARRQLAESAKRASAAYAAAA